MNAYVSREKLVMKVLDGKVAIITGGSSGIGKAASIAFAKAGAQVVIAARGVPRGQEVAHEIHSTGEAIFVRADLANPYDIEVLVKIAVDKYGRLDCAFNNAAIEEGAFAVTADFTEEEFDRTITVNLKGVWLCMKHEIRQMLRQTPTGGVIVNTSSVNGLGGAPPGSALFG
jgi:NAD(P)-dependent dehydrogenase (short-subunit alcohol dehydrogenase family)